MTSIKLNKISPESSLAIQSGITTFLDTTESSSISTGSLIINGGVGIAKKLFLGTDLSVAGIITSGTWNASTVSVAYGGTGATTFTSTGVLLGNGSSAISAGSGITYTSNTLTLPKLVSNDTTTSTSVSTGSVIISGGVGITKALYIGEGLFLDNATSNLISFNVNGSGSPTFTTRSSGTKISLLDGLSVSTVEHALGVDTSGPWLSVSNSATQSFNIFHGITNTFTFTNSQMYIKPSTASSSITTGALRVDGGVGISGSLYTGSTAFFSGNVGIGTTTANGLLQFNNAPTNRIIVIWQTANNDHQYMGFGQNAGILRYQIDTTSASHVWYTGTSSSSSTELARITGGGVFQIPGSIQGNSTASANLTLRSTSNATKGQVILDETTASTSTTTGALRVAGGVGISGAIFNGSTINSGGDFVFTADSSIRRNTSDGSDTGFITISGGGSTTDSTRGGRIVLSGNERATHGGRVQLYAGDTSAIQFYTNGDTLRGEILSTGAYTMTAGITSSSTTTGTVVVTGGVGISGAVYTGGLVDINNRTDTNSLRIRNYNTIGGANIEDDKGIHIHWDRTVGGGEGWILNQIGSGLTNAPINIGRVTNTNITSVHMSISPIQTRVYATSASSSTSTGALVVDGGVGISGSLYAGLGLNVSGSSTFNIIDMNSTKITNLGTPTANADAATKAYVDGVASGLDIKASVLAATTTSGTLASSFANGSVIDGVTLATGNRILIKNQGTATENGIYTVNASGAPTRSSDLLTGSSAAGIFTFIESGTVNSDTGWVNTNNTGSDVVGTDNLVFTQFSGAGSYLAGTGLTLTGTTFSVNASQTQITAVGTIATGVWNGTTIAVENGGTGATSLTSTGVLIGNGTSAISAGSGITYSSNILTLPGITANAGTASTSTTTGTVIVTGGVGISGSLYTGSTAFFSGNVGIGTTTANGLLQFSNSTANRKIVLWDGNNNDHQFIGLGFNTTNLRYQIDANGSNYAHVWYAGTSSTTSVELARLTGDGVFQIPGAIRGNSTASANLTLRSTSNATKGQVILDETTATTSNTTGSLRIAGGIGITNTTDASSSTNGGTITTAGGIAIAKKLFVGTDLSIGGTITVNSVDISPSTGDIKETSFSASNNVITASDVTNFLFSNGVVRSFTAQVSITIIATANLYALFELRGIQKQSSWVMTSTYIGDDTGIVFTITAGGQIQYTSTNLSGFTSNTIKFRARVTGV